MADILTTQQFKISAHKIKEKGKLVLVGGCFDILHLGHKEFLKQAKLQGDKLLVMLESDDSIQAKKGAGRPVNTQELRAEALSQQPEVDYILLIPYLKTDKDYYEMTNLIQPDIIAVTENDPALVHKQRQAESVGGQVIEVIKRLPKHSTTDIIRKNM